jgi:hypothetical protein
VTRALAGLLIGLLAGAGTAAAQGDCFPPRDSHEARTLAIASVPLVISPLGAPAPVGRTTIRLGIEGATVPNADPLTRTATICRPGKGPERIDFLFAIPRPRLDILLPAGLGLEVSWIPPVRVNGVRANVLGLALGGRIPLGEMTLGLRGHATVGLIRAPVTCDTEALSDPASECFNGTRSDDRFHPNIFGADATLGIPLAGGRVRPYFGAGVNVLHPRFQVNFTNSQGSTDNRRIEVDLVRAVAFAGMSWMAAPRWELAGELYVSPADAVSGRVAVRRSFLP